MGEYVIKHTPGNGRGRCSTKTRVFHNHSQRNFGIVYGGEGDIQRVVAMVLFHFGRIVFFFLAQTHRLCRPRFTSAEVAGPRKDAG